ncbi:non-ribosomal peptide synthetase [Amycolatopsis sp. cmx-4-61]|uniref:non-ribosomal peptide synthetase n=1 Tax=Amycolatopsis sp. cmx-4-61 TaxID=2790937 RepID=UPI00397D40F7
MPNSPDLATESREPASGLQEQWWFLDHWSDGAGAVVELSLRLRGALDTDRLRDAVRAVVERHEVLRTVFEFDGRLYRKVLPPERAGTDTFCTGRFPAMDTTTGPLFQARQADGVLTLRAHRSVADERSLVLLVEELAAAYRGVATEFAAEVPEVRSGDELAAFWSAKLAGFAVVELPTDEIRPATMSFRSDRVTHPVPAGLSSALAERDVIAYLTAATALVLSRHTGAERLVLGVGHDGRREPRAVGPYADTAPVALDLSGVASASDVVRLCRREIDEAVAHRGLSLPRLVERLGLARDASRHPVFQVGVVLAERPASFTVPGATAEQIGSARPDQRLDLRVHYTGAELQLDYAADLFDRRRIEHLATHLVTVLGELAAHPGRPPRELAMLPAAELAGLDTAWQGEIRPVDPAMTHERFSRQARRTPARLAVVQPGREITYGELDVWSNRIATHLSALGVGPDVPVAVALERGIDAVAAIIGVLKAGGAYVPLDPTYPAERLQYILADSRAKVLITTELLLKLFDEPAVPTVLTDRDREALEAASPEPVDSGVTPANLVYLMYTSGSTGRPKGVRTLHANLNWYLDWFLGTIPAEAFTSVFGTIAFSFDVSAMDIWPPLLTGGRLRLSDGLLAVPDDSPELDGVTMMNLVPSVLAEYLRHNRLPATVRTITVGGEQLAQQLVEDIWARSEVRDIHHLYGPTETTVFVTAQHLVRGDGRKVRLGRPIHSSRIDILGEDGARVPVGVPGEIHIGGPGVADGYLGRPELTAERFLPNPFDPSPDGMMYRSGDIGRWTFDGEIEFLGRKDDQVKIRGVRIELGEIEATMRRHPVVAAAVVAVTPRQELVAYVVPHVLPADLDAVSAYVQDVLPSFLVPTVFVAIDAIPLSPTGKVDRGALPPPPELRADTGTVPRTPTERVLAEIWGQILGKPALGPRDHFFQSGGHSLLAIRVVREIRSRLGLKLGVRSLFQTPVLADLAALVDKQTRGA